MNVHFMNKDTLENLRCYTKLKEKIIENNVVKY